MSTARLARLAPTLVLLGFLGYAMYAMESGLPDAAEKKADVRKGLDRMVREALAEGTTAAKKLEGKLRDPFWAADANARPTTKEQAAREPADTPATDELAEIVGGMTLEATFLQGWDQLAVIDGRIYARGQRIPIPGGDAAPGRSLLVLAVNRTGVLLKGDNRHYHLVYPDQLGKKEDEPDEAARQGAPAEIDPAGQMEMLRRLLDSPLCAMGRGLIGGAASRGVKPGAAPKGRARANRGSRPRVPAAGSP